jgi:ferredoxin
MTNIDKRISVAGTCDACGTCIAVCPVDAILLDESIIINHGVCIMCGRCLEICPVGALSKTGVAGKFANKK